MNELKPCPFCGSPAENIGANAVKIIRCSNPACFLNHADMPIKLWNTRTTPQAEGEGLSTGRISRIIEVLGFVVSMEKATTPPDLFAIEQWDQDIKFFATLLSHQPEAEEEDK